jgi:hypothetical protein
LSRIVTDPDGTQWVQIDVDQRTIDLLKDEAVFEQFCREVNAAFWHEWAEKVDKMVIEGTSEL